MPENNINSKKQNIIVKKVKKSKEEHTTGTWKIAYADFATAMMAFFILMWLINVVSQEKLKGISEFFTPVVGLRGSIGLGVDGGENKNLDEGKLRGGPQDKDSRKRFSIFDDKTFSEGGLNNIDSEQISSIMNEMQNKIKNSNDGLHELIENVLIENSPEGLKIQIMDTATRSIFKPSSKSLQPYMYKFLDVISELLKSAPNYISIEGNTSEKAEKLTNLTDQWKLSIERADSIRKYLQKTINNEQLLKITGRANTNPFDPEDRSNPRNTRIVITLLNPSSVGTIQKSDPNS